MTEMPRTACLAVLLIIGSAGQAAATGFCEVPSTSDGFVALRKAPSTSAGMMARMKAGDEVMIVGDAAPRGRWFKVYWWRGQDRHEKGFEKPAGTGWVHGSLLKDCG